MKFPSKKKGPSVGANVEQAMKDAEIEKRDERGMSPHLGCTTVEESD